MRVSDDFSSIALGTSLLTSLAIGQVCAGLSRWGSGSLADIAGHVFKGTCVASAALAPLTLGRAIWVNRQEGPAAQEAPGPRAPAPGAPVPVTNPLGFPEGGVVKSDLDSEIYSSLATELGLEVANALPQECPKYLVVPLTLSSIRTEGALPTSLLQQIKGRYDAQKPPLFFVFCWQESVGKTGNGADEKAKIEGILGSDWPLKVLSLEYQSIRGEYALRFSEDGMREKSHLNWASPEEITRFCLGVCVA